MAEPGGHWLGPMIGCDTVPRTVPVQSFRGDDGGEAGSRVRPEMTGGVSPHLDQSLALRQPGRKRWPALIEPEPQGAIGDVAGPQPDQSIVVGTVKRNEVVVLGD